MNPHLPHLCAEVCSCVPPEPWDGPVLDLLDEAYTTSIRATIMEHIAKLEEEHETD